MRKETARRAILRDTLTRLEQTNGVVTPKDLLETARPMGSPLHDYFEWDDTKAAENFRLKQAGDLIISVRVEIEGIKTHAFHNCSVVVNDVPVKGYFGTERVFSDEELKLQVLAKAIQEIKYFQKKYESLSEIDSIINGQEIKKIEERLGGASEAV